MTRTDREPVTPLPGQLVFPFMHAGSGLADRHELKQEDEQRERVCREANQANSPPENRRPARGPSKGVQAKPGDIRL